MKRLAWILLVLTLIGTACASTDRYGRARLKKKVKLLKKKGCGCTGKAETCPPTAKFES